MEKKQEIQIAEIGKDIKYIKEGLEQNNDQHKELKDMINIMSKKYAGKWVEKVIIYIAATSATIIIPIIIFKFIRL